MHTPRAEARCRDKKDNRELKLAPMCGYLQSNRLGRLGACAMEAFGLRRVVAALPPELATKVFFDGYPPATHARGRRLAGGYRKFALPAL